MAIAGVIFDLFGTLVLTFQKREHIETMQACARIMGLDHDDLQRLWGETYPQRIRGEFSSIGECLKFVARRLGKEVSDGQLEASEGVYHQFTRDSLAPSEGVVETLQFLKGRGISLGLASNCAADVPHVWPSTPLAQYFDFAAFSCEIGAAKPEPKIYRTVIEEMNLSPDAALYVGDGSDEELTGAARCGLEPVLVRVDLANTYDTQRKDVERWRGRSIQRISEIVGLIEVQLLWS